MSKKESRFSKVGNLAKSLRGSLKRGMSADAVTDKITSVVGRKYKKDTLNNNARRLRKLIPVAGEGIIRSEFLKGTRKDIRNCIKEGKTDKEILASCYEAPEYLLLLKDLQMDMDFIAYMVKDIRENPQNEDERETIIASYQAYLNNPEERDVRYIRTRYRNDAIWVENPPAQQNYQVTFYKKITHTWVIHNMGSNVWTGRYLKCMDGDDVSIRPSKKTIPIPDVNPTEIIKLSVEYDSRGKENKAMSVWKMMDANNQDCFPGDTNVLNVVIDVVNTQHKKADTTVQHSEQNAPKRYDCPKCGKNSKRVKVEDGKAFYFCSNHKGFSVNL